MTTTKIDDNIFHLFQHRPQVTLRNISMTRKMNRTPDSAKQERQKCTFSIRLFHERHMQNPAVWQPQCPNQRLYKVHGQSTHLVLLANCELLAVTSLQSPCAVQRQISHHLLQQLLAAEDCVRPLLPREFQSCGLLGLVREYPAYKP